MTLLVLPAAAGANSGFAGAEKAFTADDDATDVRTAMAPNGWAAVAWVEPEAGSTRVVKFTRRPPGGPWSDVRSLGSSTATRSELDLAINSNGAAVVAWQEPATSPAKVAITSRAKRGAFHAVERFDGTIPRVGIDASGEATVLYQTGTEEQVREAAAGGDFGTATPTNLCTDAFCTNDQPSADLAVAPTGEAIGAYTNAGGRFPDFYRRDAQGVWTSSKPIVGSPPFDCDGDVFPEVRVAIDADGTPAGMARKRTIHSPCTTQTFEDALMLAVASGPTMAGGPLVVASGNGNPAQCVGVSCS